MRGEPNAIGVSTKKLPARSEEAYKSDTELEKNKKIITDDINKAIAEWNTGKYNKLIIPQMGVGLAELPTRAPETYKFLQQELKRLEDQVTQTSTSVEEGVLSVTEADEEIELLREEIAQLEEEDELTNESNVNVIAARLMPKITPESAAKETGGKVGTRGDIMLNLVDKNGETFDEAALSILGNWPYDMEERQDVTTSDIFNIISEVLLVGKKAYIDSYLNTKEIESKKLELTALQKLQSTRPAAIVNSWSDMNFTAAQEKEVLASLIARFKDFNLYSNQDIINNFNKALAKAKTPEEKNKLIELLNCK